MASEAEGMKLGACVCVCSYFAARGWKRATHQEHRRCIDDQAWKMQSNVKREDVVRGPCVGDFQAEFQ